jgi:hypothetical protein
MLKRGDEMLSFLCISDYIDPTIGFDDIRQKDIVFVLGEPKTQLSKHILNDISGEKFSLVPTSGFKPFNLKTFVKGQLKIGGLSMDLNSDAEMMDFLSQHESLYILLLNENPKSNHVIMDYINQRQPKYVFYNSATSTRSTIGNTHIIGISSFVVERYYTS